jgi:hypothetical protein
MAYLAKTKPDDADIAAFLDPITPDFRQAEALLQADHRP